MKLRILALLCAFLMLAGCRVELPSQRSSSAASSPASSEAVPSEAVGSSSNAADSVPLLSSAPSSAVTSAAASSAPSKAASSSSSAAKPQTSKVPVSSAAPSKEQSCTLSISAADILQNKDRFSEDQLSIVPKDGVIYAENKVTIKAGDTVFDVLLRVTKAGGIPMVHTLTAFQSEYVQSIGTIAEKEFGGNSGWTYLVNGKQPPVACSSYKLSAGDRIQWLFVCGKPS